MKQPIPAALDTGRLKRVGWRRPSCLQLRPTGWRAQRCPGLRTQVRENLFDHRLLEDRRDDLQPATTIRALFQVDLEQALEQLGPAQPNRTGGAHRSPRARPAARPARAARVLAALPSRVSWRWLRERLGKRIKCSLGRVTRAASRCIKSCGDINGAYRAGFLIGLSFGLSSGFPGAL